MGFTDLGEQGDERTVPEVPVHDLFSRPIKPIWNWKEWLDRWQAAVTFEEMLGLLHCGFKVSMDRGAYGEREYTLTDRILFYFTIADGWDDHYLLKKGAWSDSEPEYNFGRDSNGNQIKKTESEVRQMLAGKAFEMLCHNFFKPMLAEREGYQSYWYKQVLQEPTFSVVQSFFRKDETSLGRRRIIRNLPDTDSKVAWERYAPEFLTFMAHVIWGWKGDDSYCSTPKKKEEQDERNRVERERLDVTKPWLIDVLIHTGNLSTLRKLMFQLDERCVAKLRATALSREIREDWQKNRPVVTIEEACYTDSWVATFLIERDVRMCEHARLEKIKVARQEKEAADRTLKELTGGQ